MAETTTSKLPTGVSTHQIQGLQSTFDEIINQHWKGTITDDHLKKMVEDASKLEQAFVEIGDTAMQFLDTHAIEPNKQILAAYVLTHQWSERAKMYMILWRDVLFEHQKAFLLNKEESAAQSALDTLFQQSKETLSEAFDSLMSYTDASVEKILDTKNVLKKSVAKWKLEANPWPTFKVQISDIPRQCEKILHQFGELQTTVEVFENVRNLVKNNIESSYAELETDKKIAASAIEFIEENLNADGEQKPGKVAARLEDMEADLKVSNHMQIFAEKLEELEKSLPIRVQVFVGTQYGIMQYRIIDFRKKINNWLESEILPVLYEIWENAETTGNGLKISLLNVRNRALLASNDGRNKGAQLLDEKDYCIPLSNFIKTADDTIKNLSIYESQVRNRLAKNFKLSIIYGDGDEFLSIPLQSTINQFKFGQNAFVDRVQGWFSGKWKNVQRFLRNVENEEALSISEKIVRLIQSRTSDSANTYYTSIFMTKGYIGDSFWVGRATELQRTAILVDQWKHGFRGAIAVTGQRFSGKSLFAELIATRHFADNTIRLAPNSSITVNGRRMTTTYNLKEALSFIQKHTLGDRPLILIDDLEYWWDTEVTLSENIRHLQRYIDSFGNRQFFVVTMSNWLKHHLDKIYDLNKVFQATMNMDAMQVDEIREAIVIRHGATHKQLVDKEGQKIRATQFRKMTNKIYKATEGNVGEALNRWTAHIDRFDDERVIQKYRGTYQLPDFINADSGMMLSALMMEKRTTEYQLRKLFGIAFKDKYSIILQRLISVGLLKRHLDGWLEINDVVVNDLGRLLEKKGFLRFHD